MPFIKGITDLNLNVGSSSILAISAQIPPINAADIERFKVAFNGASPVLGILDSALPIYDGVPCLIEHTYRRGRGHGDTLQVQKRSVL